MEELYRQFLNEFRDFLASDSEFKGTINEHLRNIDEHLCKLNGQNEKNTEFRLKHAEALKGFPAWKEHLLKQFTNLYTRTQKGYIKVALRTQILWAIFIAIGLVFLDVLKGIVESKLNIY